MLFKQFPGQQCNCELHFLQEVLSRTFQAFAFLQIRLQPTSMFLWQLMSSSAMHVHTDKDTGCN